MDKTAALTRLEPLPLLDPRALPRYYTKELAARTQTRSVARATAVGEGMSAAFYAFVTGLFVYLSNVLLVTPYPLALLTLLTWCCAGGAIIATCKAGWTSLERVQYLRGTRDEPKYLPAGCRRLAREEATLTDALFDANDDALKWNASLPLLEEHGTPKLRAIAAANREKLQARQQAIVAELGRLWSVAGRNETKELPSADS